MECTVLPDDTIRCDVCVGFTTAESSCTKCIPERYKNTSTGN